MADFIFAARPMLMLPVWSIYLVSFQLSNKSNHLNTPHFLFLIAITLVIGAAYYINQYFDYESDRINNKIGFLQYGLISKREIISAYIVLTLIGILLSICLGFRYCGIITLMVLLALGYSAPPLRLKDGALSGLLANAIGYGILIPMSIQPKFMYSNRISIFPMIYFFMTVSAIYILTTIPDRKGDISINKNTMATQWNDRSLISIGGMLLVISLFISILMHEFVLSIISFFSLMSFFYALLSPTDSRILMACKFPILLLTLIAGYYFPTYLVFIIVLIMSTRLYYYRRFGIKYPRMN